MPSAPSRPPPRDIQKIVEDQVHRWKLEQKRRARRVEAVTELPARPLPLVTVSREHGSLGSIVAERAAKLLGFSFWDQELVHLIAKQTGAEEALMSSLDERSRNSIEDFICRLLMGIESSIAEYVGHVARLVRTFESHGGAVIVGRGAQYILDPESALRVRVVCPEEIRSSRIAELRGCGYRDALRRVREVENERSSFIRRHYGFDIACASRYDLVVNTGHLSVETAAEMVAAAYGMKFPNCRSAEATVPNQTVARASASASASGSSADLPEA